MSTEKGNCTFPKWKLGMKRQQASLDCILTAGSLALLSRTPYDIRLLEPVTRPEDLGLFQAHSEFLSISGSASA